MNTAEQKAVAVYFTHAQENAFRENREARCQYYEELIAENAMWTFAGYYEDIGSDSDFANHDEWNLLIDKCRAGEVDIVLSKSAACFGSSPDVFSENMGLLAKCGVEAVAEATGPLSVDFLSSRLSACLLFNPDRSMQDKLYDSDFGIN
jgi:hypothetical protein